VQKSSISGGEIAASEKIIPSVRALLISKISEIARSAVKSYTEDSS